jgi:hypothetical protein
MGRATPLENEQTCWYALSVFSVLTDSGWRRYPTGSTYEIDDKSGRLTVHDAVGADVVIYPAGQWKRILAGEEQSDPPMVG